MKADFLTWLQELAPRKGLQCPCQTRDGLYSEAGQHDGVWGRVQGTIPAWIWPRLLDPEVGVSSPVAPAQTPFPKTDATFQSFSS